MKFLFKNILKSITKHKVQALSLFALIIFATATFAGIINASNTIKNSYNNFVKQSNPHDFVIDLNSSSLPSSATNTQIKNNVYADWDAINNTNDGGNFEKKFVSQNDIARLEWSIYGALSLQHYNVSLSYRDTREFYDSKNDWLFKTMEYNPSDDTDKVIITAGHAPRPTAPEHPYDPTKSNTDIDPDSLEQIMINQKWAEANHCKLNSILWINEAPYLVVGYAYSFDMGYPTFDRFNPISNTNKNSVVYCRTGAYLNYGDVAYSGHFAAQSSSDREQYIVGRITNLNKNDNASYIVSQSLMRYMLYIPPSPSDSKFNEVSRYLKANWWIQKAVFDTSIQNNLSRYFQDNNLNYLIFNRKEASYTFYLRSNALSTAEKISFFITLMFMLIFVSVAIVIIAIITKKRIEDDKRQIGVFKALGISNNKIALAYTLFPVAISLVAILVGYVASFIIQYFMTGMFNTLFIIQFDKFNFSLLTFFSSLILILGIISVISWFSVVYYTKRVSTAQLMNQKE